MIDKYERKRLNAGLKEIAGKMKDYYSAIRNNSEKEYRSTLQPYETFKPQEGFYSEKYRQQYCATVNELKEQALNLLSDYSESVTKEYTKAPSNEALNVITLVNSRSQIPAEEIDALMTRYGADCPMVYNALKEKAISLNYWDFKDHPLKAEYDNIAQLTNGIQRITGNGIEQNPSVSLAALNQTIDMALPSED